MMKDTYSVEIPAHFLETVLELLMTEPEILDVILDQLNDPELDAKFRPLLDKDVTDIVREEYEAREEQLRREEQAEHERGYEHGLLDRQDRLDGMAENDFDF